MLDLTEIEIDLLKKKADGMLDKEIADEYEKSWANIKNRFSIIYNKLGALNGPNAVYIAMKKGIIS